jgi:chloramphenicol-sensitive protein RarD
MNKGILSAASAYLLWGLLPIYWKILHNVSAFQIMTHRVVWSLIFMIILLLITRQLHDLRQAARSRKILGIYAIAACILSVNWLMYIWAVNAGFVVETSLGYFINPLINVLFGVLFLHEKLRTWQWLPIGLATTGVIYLTVSYGELPWIALVLAFSFAVYGLIKKTAPLNATISLSLETAILFLPATAFLTFVEIGGTGAFGHSGLLTNTLLVLTGVVTAFPLLLFGSAARKINLSTLGILQYITPTCQFLLGVIVYGESFSSARLVGFTIIWVALAIYWIEGALSHRKKGLNRK